MELALEPFVLSPARFLLQRALQSLFAILLDCFAFSVPLRPAGTDLWNVLTCATSSATSCYTNFIT
jgi:hypothetical protein